MQADVATRKEWTDALLPRVKQIVANYLIAEAPFEQDARQATDLIVLTLNAVRIAVRLRHFKYLSQYGEQFTIRATIPSGRETELGKIISGWGDYFFYGFEDPHNPFGLSAWLFGDLRIFRLWHNRQLAMGLKPWIEKQNGDPASDSGFHAYRISDLPDQFVIGRYPKVG